MTSIAIIGAGAGLGAATARRFGAEGFTVGLISRNEERLDALAAELAKTVSRPKASPPTSATSPQARPLPLHTVGA